MNYPFFKHTQPCKNSNHNKTGMVMVFVLWIVVLLGALASTLAWDVLVNSKLALAQREQQIAYNLARSGIALAMTHLANDLLVEDQENRGNPYDAYSDVWAQPPEEKDLDKGGVKMGKGIMSYEITDEESKININKASAQLLRAMLEFYGLDETESDDLANAICDWRDSDNNVLGDDESTGLTENEYYSSLYGQKINKDLADEDLLYRCPNEPFFTIEELIDVQGMSDELFWGPDAITKESVEIAKRSRIAKGRSVASLGPKRRSLRRDSSQPMCDIITVQGEGNLNINTASEEVLTIVLYAANNLTDMNSAKSLARTIVNYRGDNKSKRKNLRPDDAFKSAEDLSKISGLDNEDLAIVSNLSSLGISIGFKSNIFAITGTGRVVKDKRQYQTEKSITAIVKKNLDAYNPDDARLANLNLTTARSSRRKSVSVGSKSKADEDNLIRIPAIRVLQWIE